MIRQEVAAAMGNGRAIENDRLLTPQEAAVTVQWLSARLTAPFSRRLLRKSLRFSEAGVRKWLAVKKREKNLAKRAATSMSFG